MIRLHRLLERLPLRYAILGALVTAGIIPLVVSSVLLIWQNRQVIQEQEEEELLFIARTVSRAVDGQLQDLRRDAEQLASAVLTLARGDVGAAGVQEALGRFGRAHPDLVAVRLLGPDGRGHRLSSELAGGFEDTLDAQFKAVLGHGMPEYQLLLLPPTDDPALLLGVPAGNGPRDTRLVVQLLSRLYLSQVVREEAQGQAQVFLLDENRILWSDGATPDLEEAVTRWAVGRRAAAVPVSLVTRVSLPGVEEDVLALVSRVSESNWAVVVLKPLASAFEAVDQMIFNTVASSLLLVALALTLSFLVARRMSQPIHSLARATHDVASGNFGERIPTHGLLLELSQLGQDFNRMSDHVERYIRELKAAAQANRDLFIGSLRAFAAAIDAKDPYTRGHSERVARVARVVARHLGMKDAFQEQVWIAGILHDVGKIGVEDRVLKKGGQLSPEEFEQMKLHTVVGAEILSSIDLLKDMLPAVRWHHEAWNGKGYPDGLKGEEIPLIARIVAVADTFDAITTNRPYQTAYTLSFAVETIIKLTGSRFDAKITTAFLRAYERGDIEAAEEGPRPAEPVLASARETSSRILSMT